MRPLSYMDTTGIDKRKWYRGGSPSASVQFAAEILQFQIDHHLQVGPLQSTDFGAVDARHRRPRAAQGAAFPGSFPD
jgi:hypothetical protein